VCADVLESDEELDEFLADLEPACRPGSVWCGQDVFAHNLVKIGALAS
jgi:hypothetical protein